MARLEDHKTESEYERSYSFKLFLFQLVNYFISLAYTAFFKGQFYSYPGDPEVQKSLFTLVWKDKCDAIGCSYEVAALLVLLMFGKQFLSIIAYMKPMIQLKLKRKVNNSAKTNTQRCEDDYNLQEIKTLHLHDEYIEVGTQFALVTLFVNMFPLAPLLAIISNIIELRLDACKYVTLTRRPLTRRVRDIGAWQDILQLLSYLSIVTNGFVISFTTSFVPRMVYKYLYSTDGSMQGFINWQLVQFDTARWGSPEDEGYLGPAQHHNISICYFNSPSTSAGQEAWWIVIMARLTFVVVFEHLVFILIRIISNSIPSSPPSLTTQMTREKMCSRDLRFQDARQEMIRQARMESFYNYTCVT